MEVNGKTSQEVSCGTELVRDGGMGIGGENSRMKMENVVVDSTARTRARKSRMSWRIARMNAHARSAESVKMCVRHGIDIIYHANFADEETLLMGNLIPRGRVGMAWG